MINSNIHESGGGRGTAIGSMKATRKNMFQNLYPNHTLKPLSSRELTGKKVTKRITIGRRKPFCFAVKLHHKSKAASSVTQFVSGTTTGRIFY